MNKFKAKPFLFPAQTFYIFALVDIQKSHFKANRFLFSSLCSKPSEGSTKLEKLKVFNLGKKLKTVRIEAEQHRR